MLFFFGTLLPTSNLFPKLGSPLFDKESWCIGSIMAERFLYMPSIGYAGCAVIAVYAVCRRLIPQLDISGWAQRIFIPTGGWSTSMSGKAVSSRSSKAARVSAQRRKAMG